MQSAIMLVQINVDVYPFMQSGFQGSQVLGVVPIPPLADLDIPTAKRQLEVFKSEARGILEEANIADDLSAPLAVAAAEAENLTLGPIGNALPSRMSQA